MRLALIALLALTAFACRTDADGDGVSSATDCDSEDDQVFPGAYEFCDGIDNDCNGTIDDPYDQDGDGVLSCGVDEPDCDDLNAEVHPDADEACNALDDNCDGEIDEGFDGDGDGVASCNGDCDDNDATTAEGAQEVCDAVDNDCDGLVDEESDFDHDGTTRCGPDGQLWTLDDDCDDLDKWTFPGAPEQCDGIDNDCDGYPDLDEYDFDGDQWAPCEGDCDDEEPDANPGWFEFMCDEIDNDCDPATLDQDNDSDGDGFDGCNFDSILVWDCDPGDASIHPEAPETCDFTDQDCDGLIDEDFDLDFDGYTSCDGDCDDLDITRNPGAFEACDEIDNNCDGQVDEDYDDSDIDGIVDCLDTEQSVDDCADGFDNDGDGFADCDEHDCVGVGACPDGEVCINGEDDDGDGFSDCFDDDCYGDAACECSIEDALDCTTNTAIYGELWWDETGGEMYAYDCPTGLSSYDQAEDIYSFTAPYDGRFTFELSSYYDYLHLITLDAAVGCQPDACDDINWAGGPVEYVMDAGDEIYLAVEQLDPADANYTLQLSSCLEAGDEVCDDGLDNDLDGMLDCLDPDCSGDPVCVEVCDNGSDDNGDGLIDCADPYCSGDPTCPDQCNSIDTVTCGFTDSINTAALPSDVDNYAVCDGVLWPFTGPEVTYHFVSAVSATVTFNADTAYDAGIIVHTNDSQCAQNPVGCARSVDDVYAPGVETVSMVVWPGRELWFTVDGWDLESGGLDVSIDCN